VANGQYQGGGMFVAPLAKVDDGLLDLSIINKVSRLKIYGLLPRYVKGTHLTLNFVEYYKCRTVKVENISPPAPLNMDGEVTDSTPADFKLADKKLMIFAPKGNEEKQ
jgi:diacylglycerol kinase (ATP)